MPLNATCDHLLSSYATATALINDESPLTCPVMLEKVEDDSTEPWSFVVQFPLLVRFLLTKRPDEAALTPELATSVALSCGRIPDPFSSLKLASNYQPHSLLESGTEFTSFCLVVFGGKLCLPGRFPQSNFSPT